MIHKSGSALAWSWWPGDWVTQAPLISSGASTSTVNQKVNMTFSCCLFNGKMSAPTMGWMLCLNEIIKEDNSIADSRIGPKYKNTKLLTNHEMWLWRPGHPWSFLIKCQFYCCTTILATPIVLILQCANSIFILVIDTTIYVVCTFTSVFKMFIYFYYTQIE